MGLSSRKRNIRIESFFILWFIVSPILSLEETAAPGMVYVSLITVPLIVLCFCKGSIKARPYNTIAVLLFLSALISLATGSYGSLNLNFVKRILFVLFFICCTSATLGERDIIFLFKGCYFVAVGIALLILASYLGGYAHNDSSLFLSRYSVGITGVYKNPNYLTAFINISFFLLACILFQRKNTFNQGTIIVGSLFLFLLSYFLSGTRASFVTAFTALLLVFLEQFFKKGRKNYIVIISFIIIGVIVYEYWAQIQVASELFLGNRTLTADESRTDSWLRAIHHWEDSPIFGCGPNTWATIGKSSDDLNYLHNLVLELLLEQGLIGLLLFVMLVFWGFRRTKKEDRFFLMQLMFVTGFPLFFQNGLWEVNFWRFIIINRVAFKYSIY